mmetsp:Transcript_10205/g.29248  ORF Transcript_10205/g.29248 Transcript_10205/m.29248 type:complete len:158 (-) Transcript_10205:168-641(-)|eukprot:CAMPEP_0117673286 /NCGR_PEP_ID=MMETSP0804-20121206/14389_1 /TAXON_ID=1074897 /ORGANISM="Tetraselmis astigmatica, Strain CCMP880" /LENGTH=157 /DNA_ID=CAMNT_0005482009 /DNA_START=115 /DNA_END=588 /DNA_ORIENTATION=-
MAIYGLPYTDDELLFLQNVALPGWIALALMPKNRMAHRFAVFLAVLAGLLYTALMVTMSAEGSLDDFKLETMTSLDGLTKAFTRKELVLAGWIHYVAFDLMAAVWSCQDAAKRDVPHLLLLPVLFFTLMAGPIGLVLYMIVRLPFSVKEQASKPKEA